MWFNQIVAKTLPVIPKPIVKYFSSQYIAGETKADAVRAIRQLNQQNIMATLDVLGEFITTKEEATVNADAYIDLLHTIDQEKLDSNVSVKLSSMGLLLDYDFCLQNVKRILEVARGLHGFVRIDMEDSSCTTATLKLYRDLRKSYENVGLAVQAYLRRTIQDIRDLLPLKPNIRLCKGIYIESRTIAYRDKAIINFNFKSILEELFKNHSYVGIATHDEKLVWAALELIDKYNLSKDRYEFQMLLGVDEELRSIILNAGHRLRVYVPFGVRWYAYSVRRLKENPEIAGHIIRGIFGLDHH